MLTPNVIENVKVKQNPKDRSQIIVTWDIPTDYHDIVLYSVLLMMKNRYFNNKFFNLYYATIT